MVLGSCHSVTFSAKGGCRLGRFAVMLHHSLALSPIVFVASAAIAIGGQNAATSPLPHFHRQRQTSSSRATSSTEPLARRVLAWTSTSPRQHEVQSYQRSCSSI